MSFDIPSSYWECMCGTQNHRSIKRCCCGRERVERTFDFGVDKESELHDEIIQFCRSRRWPYIHSRMDRPSTTALGTPDFIILAPHGRTLVIECKTKNGKQTPEQKGFQIQCEVLGHAYHLVRSFEEFRVIASQEVLNAQSPETSGAPSA